MKVGLFEYFRFQIQNLILVEWKDKLYLQGLKRFECISGLFHCQNSPTVQCPPLCLCVNSLDSGLGLITLCPLKPLRGYFVSSGGAKNRGRVSDISLGRRPVLHVNPACYTPPDGLRLLSLQ